MISEPATDAKQLNLHIGKILFCLVDVMPFSAGFPTCREKAQIRTTLQSLNPNPHSVGPVSPAIVSFPTAHKKPHWRAQGYRGVELGSRA